MLLTATMKNQVRNHYGPAALTGFKASPKWRRCWYVRFSVSLRRKTNKKPLSAAERLPKAKRFLARLRWRLRKGKGGKATPNGVGSSSNSSSSSSSSSSSTAGGTSASSSSSSSSSSSGGGSGGGEISEEQRQRIERQHRGHDGAAVFAAQGSHGLAMDCGLCALKNVTADRDIDGKGAFEVALALQSELEAEVCRTGASSPIRHFEVSGKAIRDIARKSDFALYRLARSDGGCVVEAM
jgi:hypothetical protein